MSDFPPSEAPFLQTMMYMPEDEEEIRYQQEKNFRDTANCVNAREIALYDLVENQTGQQWFLIGNPLVKRLGYRKCFYATTAGAVTNIAHGIADVANCRFVKIYGTMQDSPFTTAFPIPLSGAAPVVLTVGAANIVVNDTTAAYVGYTAYVVLEYVRDR